MQIYIWCCFWGLAYSVQINWPDSHSLYQPPRSGSLLPTAGNHWAPIRTWGGYVPFAHFQSHLADELWFTKWIYDMMNWFHPSWWLFFRQHFDGRKSEEGDLFRSFAKIFSRSREDYRILVLPKRFPTIIRSLNLVLMQPLKVWARKTGVRVTNAVRSDDGQN